MNIIVLFLALFLNKEKPIEPSCTECIWGNAKFSVGGFVDHMDNQSKMYGNVRFTCNILNGKPQWIGNRGNWLTPPYFAQTTSCHECSLGDRSYSPGAVVLSGNSILRCVVTKDNAGNVYAKWN